jgi:hypothetical protein
VASATLCLGLAFLTQSRGVAIGLVAGGLVVLTLPPDRVRRFWTAGLAVLAVAATAPWLIDPYNAFRDDGLNASAPDIETAAAVLTAVTLVAGLAMLLLAVLDSGLRVGSAPMGTLRTVARAAAALVVVAAAVGALAAVGDPVQYVDDKRAEFTDVDGASSTGSTRLGSVGGQRYDLWRIAADEFADKPVIGTGEGGYQFAYYRERATDRNLTDPHSLPLRVLAETGIVGLLLIGVGAGALYAGIASRWRTASQSARRAAVGLVAGGTVVLVQAAIDWFWLVPGLMGIGLVALALAYGILGRENRRGGRLPIGAAIPAVAVLVAATVSLVLLYLADFELRDARAAADRGQVARQLDAAERAARWNPTAVAPLYLQASALEALRRRDEARAKLLEALREEPQNHATLGLLGDLETRAGDRSAARRWYRRALALNPRDVGLQELAGVRPEATP